MPLDMKATETAALAELAEEKKAEELRAWLKDRARARKRLADMERRRFKDRVPKSVAILAMGMSHQEFTLQALTMGGIHEVAEEIWGINAVGGVYQCDRVFQMDDVMLGERAAVAHSCSAGIMKWMRQKDGPPIYGPREHPDYPRMFEFPLEETINALQLPHPYMNNTVPYAFAYALKMGVPEIQLHGCDYTYANSHAAESGHACLAILVHDALRRGVRVAISPKSTLLDMNSQEKFYGYGSEKPFLHRVVENGMAKWQIRPYPPEPPKPA